MKPSDFLRSPMAFASAILIVCFLAVMLSLLVLGCKNDGPTTPLPYQPLTFETTGQDFLMSALDEIESIADLHVSGPRKKLMLSKASTDSVFAYGRVNVEGLGEVVTERHTYPKGMLLITLRSTHGKADGHVVTETKRYVSFADLETDHPQQSNITEVYGLSADTIVTRVLRNGVLETFTFRLPVVSRVVNPLDGSVRITSRSGRDGKVISEIRSGDGSFVQSRETWGATDGSTTTYTLYADSSWRNVRSLGLSDGSIFRETTSGE